MITDPNLECGACYSRLKEFGEVPLCKTETGCHIYDLANDPRITSLYLGYMRYKRLNNSNAPESLQIKCLTDCGILELGYDLLNSLDSVFNEYLKYERDQAEEQNKLKEALKSDKRNIRG